ncbi:MAG: hypothetical protein AB7F99_05985 [Vicinamibacterales bacterium]
MSRAECDVLRAPCSRAIFFVRSAPALAWIAGALAFGACTSTPQPAPPRIVELIITNGTLYGTDIAPATPAGVISVEQNQAATLRFVTDDEVTIHLHGYEIYANVVPGAASDLKFDARATGRFVLEAHGLGDQQDTTIAYVEVLAR